MFDPYDLSIEVTPAGISRALAGGQLSDALMMSFRLNERVLLVKCVEAIPVQDSEWAAGSVAIVTVSTDCVCVQNEENEMFWQLSPQLFGMPEVCIQ